MTARYRRVILLLLGAGLFAGLTWLALRGQAPDPGMSGRASITLAPGAELVVWQQAIEPREYSFPSDHGPHPEYLTEWWYYTGNLETQSGREFAYQLTFFRRGLTPGAPELDSDLAMQSLYFAHFAIIDVEAGLHQEWERFGRGAAGLAGAQGSPFRVWLQDWSAMALDPRGDTLRLSASAEEFEIELELNASKPIVAHGDEGLSPKSEEPGNASYYLSFTRLATQGTITSAGEAHAVEGLSWFDHEWSTSALGDGAIGWDWFSLQLNDGSELMLFQIRNQDGTLEPVSSGTYVHPDGSWMNLERRDFRIENLGRWTSGESGVEYPSLWRVTVPELGLDLHVEPLLVDQEMNLSLLYWEGAVRVEGVASGRRVEGRGFVELTGYGESMQGVF